MPSSSSVASARYTETTCTSGTSAATSSALTRMAGALERVEHLRAGPTAAMQPPARRAAFGHARTLPPGTGPGRGIGGTAATLGPCHAASGSRPSAVPRTRSTPTSSPARCWPTACSPRPPPTRPTSSWSTPAPSSRRPGRNRSTPSSRSSGDRKAGAEVVVTGCLAERHGDELAAAIPEVSVRGFGVPVQLGRKGRARCPSFDLLNLPRPRSARPWAYVKIAEGCDRACGFCAIPSFRGKQRSRSIEAILDEVDAARRARGRARRAGPRRRTAAIRASARRRSCRSSRPSPRVSTRAAALPLSERAHRQADRRHLRHRRAVLRPVAAARVAAVAAPHAPVGRRRSVPAPHRGHPRREARRGVPLELHRRLSRARPRTTTISCSRSSTRRSSTGAASSRTPREQGTYAAGPRRRGRRRLVAERLAELRELQDAHHRASDVTNWWVDEVEVLVDEPGVGRTSS